MSMSPGRRRSCCSYSPRWMVQLIGSAAGGRQPGRVRGRGRGRGGGRGRGRRPGRRGGQRRDHADADSDSGSEHSSSGASEWMSGEHSGIEASEHSDSDGEWMMQPAIPGTPPRGGSKRKADGTPQQTPAKDGSNAASAAPARKKATVDGAGGIADRMRREGRVRKPTCILGFVHTSLANMAVGNQ